MPERLHKLLAQHGLGSRREIEKWMLAGRVLLNDQPAQPGASYTSGDRVVIDGRDVSARLKVTSAPKAIIYHKPQGQPISTDGVADEPSDFAKAVMESLPAVRGARWLVVNTMQAGDSGLLLLTSDGRLADALRRRAESIPSAYVARVLVPFPDFDAESIPRVVQYDDDTVEFDKIEPAGGEGTNRWFRVESHRAHRRAAVRALFESRGLKVSRVIQVQFAGLELPRDLPRSRHRALSENQVARLYELAGLPEPPTAREVHEQRTPRGSRSAASPRDRDRKAIPRAKENARGKARPDGNSAGQASRRPTGNRRSGR